MCYTNVIFVISTDILSQIPLESTIPQSHDMPVSTETGDAVRSGHLHNISPQHEGRLSDVVFVDAGLGGHGHHLGLFLRTQHGELGILPLL